MPASNQEIHLGRIKTASNGMNIEIISYNHSRDITVRFEDGEIVEHRTIKQFNEGNIKHPNKNNPSRCIKSNADAWMEESMQSTKGERMDILEYRGSNDIDVKFENGYIARHKSIAAYKSGQILNRSNLKEPNKKDESKKINKSRQLKTAHDRIERIGTTHQANNGQEMTIIAYRSSVDIDIRFEDNTIIEHTTYGLFKSGAIRNPNKKMPSPKNKEKKRMGEEGTNTNGDHMKIIAYKNATDLDILFDDGSISKHRDYISFKRGHIAHPKK